jgi:hypothetical protein
MVEEGILTACHVLNSVLTRNKEITTFDEWENKRLKLSYLRTRGCFAKVNVLGYAFHSIGYRFYIVESEVFDMHVGTIMESNDAISLRISFL